MKFLIGLFVSSVLTAAAFAAELNSKVEARVSEILSKMTLDEKLDYIGGYQGFNIMPIPRLGLPELVMADGPAGVRNFGPTNAYPAPICLAATWNKALASEFGKSIGRDARARGVHIWLGPGVNLTRQPQGGRNFEYFGEDPFLTTQLAVPIIKAVQGSGVVATVKHFAANEQEHDRHTVSSQVDERTLREIYLPPFEAAVKSGGVWAVMTSYNLVNGIHASEHAYLIQDVLKGEWGFEGPVMSDWDSVYSTLGPVKNGLDLEMPSGKFMNRAAIMPLLKSGKVTEAMIDDKVRRILRMAVSMKFLDRPQKDNSVPLDDQPGTFTALQIARQGIVLLKNERSSLPLDRSIPSKVLIVGPNATNPNTGGGGSSFTTPHRTMDPLTALREAAGPNVKIEYVPVGLGAEVAAMNWKEFYLPESDSEPGIRAEYFKNTKLEGPPALVRTENSIAYEWRGEPAPGIGATDFSVRWTTRIRVDKDGEYALIGRSDDGMRVFLDDKPLFANWRDQGATRAQAKADLRAGQWYNVRVEYYQGKGSAVAQFGISDPAASEKARVPNEVLADADAVIAFVGFSKETESEGFDRPFELAPEQESMLRDLVSRHNRVIVVLNAGASVDAREWVSKAGAILMAWYPGQSGSKVLAEIVFGDTNPSGKLPITFERDFSQSYATKDYPPAKNGQIRYDEGVFVGYRYADKNELKPLFPFGHGLSYTTFAYKEIKIIKDVSGAIEVVATIENTGRIPGEEVVQMYVHAPGHALPRAPRELKGFARVQIAPGQKQEVRIPLNPDDLRYYDVAAKQWKFEPGSYQVFVGSSSRQLPLEGVYTFEATP